MERCRECVARRRGRLLHGTLIHGAGRRLAALGVRRDDRTGDVATRSNVRDVRETVISGHCVIGAERSAFTRARDCVDREVDRVAGDDVAGEVGHRCRDGGRRFPVSGNRVRVRKGEDRANGGRRIGSAGPRGSRLVLDAALAETECGERLVTELGLRVVLVAVDDLVVFGLARIRGIGRADSRAVVVGTDVADLVAGRVVPRSGVRRVGQRLVHLVAEGADSTVGDHIAVGSLTRVATRLFERLVAVDDLIGTRTECTVIATVRRVRIRAVDVLGFDSRGEKQRIEVGEIGGQPIRLGDPAQLGSELSISDAAGVFLAWRATVFRERGRVDDRCAGLDLIGNGVLEATGGLEVLGVDRVHVVGRAAGGGHIGDVAVDDRLVVVRERGGAAVGNPVDGRDRHAVRTTRLHHRAARVDQRWRTTVAVVAVSFALSWTAILFCS